MAFINRICDKVFVINLDSQKERLAEFDSHMKAQNIKYERFNAIKGSTIQNDDRLTEYCNTFCTDGIKGCALSHHSIWQYMINNDLNNVMVFEDDAIIDENFDRDLQHVWNHLPKDYDIIYFGSIFGGLDNSIMNTLFKKVIGIDNEEINEFVHKSKGTAGTHALMISRQGAKKFINKKINCHIDLQLLTWIKTYNYKAYAVNENIVETSQDDSTLSDSYPLILNSILKKFHLNNNKNPATFDWGLSENFMKLGMFNINYLIVILMGLVLLLPISTYKYFLLWLTIEFLVSFDIKNTIRFLLFITIPMGIKIFLTK